MPESQAQQQNPAATEPIANPEEEIQAKKAAAVELNGNEVKNGHDEESRDTNGEDVDEEQDEQDEVDEEEDDTSDQVVENTDTEANGKQNRKRGSDFNGADVDELNGSDDVVNAKKSRTETDTVPETKEVDEEDSNNAVEADAEA